MERPHQDLYHAPFNPWLIALVATIATFMEVLDTSIANVALPHIAGNLGATTSDSTWVLTSYLVANAAILPATAWLGSVFGRKNYYMVSVALFTVASLLCGMATSLHELVFFRAIQGLAGGGMQPVTQAILVDTFPARQRGAGMALFGMTVVLAPVIGPTLGGWITDNHDWRWIFLINVPMGALALTLSQRFLSDPPFLHRRLGPERWRVDYMGFAMLGMGLGALQMMLDLGEQRDWFSSGLIQALGLATVVLLVGGVYWELTRKEPILDLGVLKSRNLRLSCIHMAVFGATLYGSIALLPMMMQSLMGYTAQLSGLVVSPGGLVVALMMPLVGFLLGRIDARWMIALGMAIGGAALWWMGSLSLQADFRTLVMARCLQGLGLSMIFVPINTLAYSGVAPNARNAASSLMSIARNMGGGIGIGLVTALLTRGAQVHQANLVSRLVVTDPALQGALSGIRGVLSARGFDPVMSERGAYAVVARSVAEQAGMLSYMDQFRILAVASLLVIPVVALMRRQPHHHPAAA